MSWEKPQEIVSIRLNYIKLSFPTVFNHQDVNFMCFNLTQP